MAVEAKKRSKTKYKLVLVCLKYLPLVLALIYATNSVLSFFNIYIGLSHIGGLSLLPWLFIYLISSLFNYCKYYKMFLWYIFITDAINCLDYYIGIPVDNYTMLGIHLSLICFVLLIMTIKYVKGNKRTFTENNR